MKLKFCPYDFKDIDEENLAYELTFPKGWNWERIKRETIVGTEKMKFIRENDRRRYEHFRSVSTVEHVILLETRKPGGKNGFKLFLEWIKTKEIEQKKKQEKKNHANLGVEFESKMTDEDEDDVFNYDEDDYFSYDEGDFEQADEYRDRKMVIHREVIDKIDTFVDEHHNPVMYALPCCPFCHNRLPLGWREAEDFGAISLMAPSGRGKTTFLLSMMDRNWNAFQNLDPNNKYKINITAAHLDWDERDATYQDMVEKAEQMCQYQGMCPDNTDRENWIPPIFLHVQYDKHIMIIGLYDNAGENLRKHSTMENPGLRMLLDRMFAEMFLFDPNDLNIVLPKKRAFSAQQRKEDVELISIEKQGEYQKENQGRKISGMELLRQLSSPLPKKEVLKEFWEMYNNHIHEMQLKGYLDHLKEMYFLGIIIKSDLLESVKEIRSKKEFDPLFDRNTNDMLEKNSMDMRRDLVQDMLNTFNLFGDLNNTDDTIKRFRTDFGEIDQNEKSTGRQAISWHCISALGCDADSPESGGKLYGSYNPIRVAEPLITCIYKRLVDKGWV